jgi:protein-S-isoprenylcysteine O-methyltransferase Ste14
MTILAIEPFDQKIRIGALRLGAALLVPLLVLTPPCFPADGLAVEAMKLAGAALILACVLGRLWAILYIGRHKNRGVMTDGPYSITRNPLYFFSTLGAFGFGLMFCKLSLALLLGSVVLLILYLTARREQGFLEAQFGADYASYAVRVPMFLPRPGLFATETAVTFSPRAVGRNLRDALVFLAAIPLADAAQTLRLHLDLIQTCLP